jgi:hypothetical protein
MHHRWTRRLAGKTNFPTVSRQQAVALLEEASELLLAPA